MRTPTLNPDHLAEWASTHAGRIPKTKSNGRSTPSPPHEAQPWQDRLTLGKGDKVKSTIANATLIFTHEPNWSNVLAYDARAEEPVLVARPPFLDCPEPLLRTPRPLTDADDVRAAQWLEERFGITLPPSQVHSALNTVAWSRPFDRVRDYLDGLTWDGIERLNRWAVDSLGTPDTAYVRAVSRRWMISAVARTQVPGCKADHVLVLEGPQGIGKSSALRILAGKDHFGDDIPPVGTKDAQQYLAALWIVELAEMDAATRAQASTLKRFLTTVSDRYRPSYGRRTIVHRRRCVFAGSVNLGEYLKDSTGGRRFWPIRCTSIDLEGLALARDQLWAEAVSAWRANEPWHLNEGRLIEAAVKEQAARLERDPWADEIADYLQRQNPEFVTTETLLREVVGMQTQRMTKAERNRVCAVMRIQRWEYKEGPNRQRGWKSPTQDTEPPAAMRGRNDE